MYQIKLTPYAKIFYFEWLLDPTSYRYNIPIIQDFHGELDITKLKIALKRYIAECVVLNSHIENFNNEPHWVKNEAIAELEYSEQPIDLINYISKPFDLYSGPLYRFLLLRLDDNTHRFVLVFHHLVIDGSSVAEGIINAISNYYNDETYVAKYSINQQIEMLSDLATTLDERLTQIKDPAKEFWHNTTNGVESLDLRFLTWQETENQDNEIPIKTIRFSFDQATLAKLATIRKQYGISAYNYSQAIFAFLLYRYTGQDQIAINYPIAIREGTDFIYGAQVNTNIIVFSLNKDMTFIDLFDQIQSFKKEVVKYSYHPITDIMSGGNSGLLNACFGQTTLRDRPLLLDKLNTEIISKYNIDSISEEMLYFEQQIENEQINYRARYNSSFIDTGLLNNFCSIYQRLFTEILDDLLALRLGKKITDYALLNQQQYQKIICEFNHTEKEYPKKTIHQLFEEQTLKTPDNIAVIFKKKTLTYKELNIKANQLANYILQSRSIKSDDLIALYLDRSEYMIIAILAVLKTGAAYVPIDTAIPQERLKYILDDTKAKIILTDESQKERLASFETISINNKKVLADLTKQAADNPITNTKPNNLTYVLYTSGTTGNPKGVMVEHASCVNKILQMIAVCNMGDEKKVLFKTNYIFDVSFSDVFTTLLVGACLVVTKKSFDVEEITEKLAKFSIDECHFTPSQFEAIKDIKNFSTFQKLKVINFSGEALYPKLLKDVSEKTRCINYYGPTESGEVTFADIKYAEGKNEVSIIGKAFYNSKLFVLDKNLIPVPIGALGELYLGGDCLARGYLNRAELTAERFIPNPFQTEEEKKENRNSRIYKTGDLVRILPDGNLEYIGRNDDQVKIRGFRIELGEIENKLLSYPSIKQAIAIVKGTDSNKHIAAYYTAEQEIAPNKLSDHLALTLPHYMIPNVFVYLSKMPLTVNGKIDKKSLPESSFTNESEYVPPRNELEKQVCEIYAQVLNLSVEQLSIYDDFFRMGGNSISSIQIVSRIREQLGIRINLQDIFQQKNIADLANNVLSKQSISKETFVLGKIENKYLANNLQQGFIYHAIRHGQTDDAYLSQLVWQYQMPIDESKFKEAWILIQKKHPSLRLKFSWDKDLVQIIDKSPKLDFRVVETADIQNLILKDRKELYDLKKGNLFRIYLVKTTNLCMFSCHHIIIDGWSYPVLLNNLHEVYAQLLENKQPKIAEDITYQQAQNHLQEHKNENLAYWKEYLTQIEDKTDLSSLIKPEASHVQIKNLTKTEKEKEQTAEILDQKFIKLKDFCQKNSITINAVIQYAWHKILHIYGNANTTVVGTVVAGRNIPIDNIENTIGLFINTLPLIFNHDNDLSLLERIKLIQESITTANSKSNVNLADLQSEGERLFDSLVVYENFPTPKSATTIKYKITQGIAKLDYPLTLIIYEKPQGLFITTKYAGELFDSETVESLLNKLSFFVDQILENSSKKALNYLTPTEYQKIVIDYNQTEKDYPKYKTIHQLFEEQVLKTPDNIAVVFENRKLTYQELNNKANQLANYILKHSTVKPDDLVAVLLERSEHMVIAILAVLKTGAAYVPIDPNYPQARIEYILQDTKAKVLIKNNKAISFPDLVSISVSEAEAEDRSNPNIKVFSNNLIYVIYTSGTTGKPKGAMIEHKAIASYVSYLIETYKITSQTKGSQYANFCFDATVIEIYPIILSGGTLHIIDSKYILDPAEINNFFVKNDIQYAFLPTQFAESFFKQKSTVLKNLIIGGDKLKNFIPQKYQVTNAYGLTETTVHSSSFIVKKKHKNIPIGTPIANTKIYILDKSLSPMPIGALGELYIGGIGIARGYLNQPQLTAEKFIKNPFVKSERLYKTGDLVRMLPNGNIEYMGRSDHQVKIRGYRIEIGEIENKLINYHEIKQAVVIPQEQNKNKYLAAYYVADNKLDENKIKEHLAKELPEYMIPSVFVLLKEFPLTYNGKLDKKALPLPNFEGQGNYQAPINEQEKIICKAFAKVLGIKKIGVNDDFFSLGGNSIQAIKLISILQTNFDIKVADIFNLRTPKKIAQSSVYGKNFLQHKLEQVKLAYQKEEQNQTSPITTDKFQSYLKSIESLPSNVSSLKPIKNVLLTGATGYLGCNLLNQLLGLTDYKIYLLVRANSQAEAAARVNSKYQYYFNTTIESILGVRLFIVNADIEKEYLGLSQKDYVNLTGKIDSTIHAAANVKHYGSYDGSYSTNVQATINLLEFVKQTKIKDFHYISTTGVLLLKNNNDIGTEDTMPNTSEVLNNIYVQTKLLGEHQTAKYRKLGLTCNIYRVGNLAFMSKNHTTQENIEDNAFFHWLKYLFVSKVNTKIINTVEVSQTDLTAKAIVKIFDKKLLVNNIYHLFNPNLFDLTQIFEKYGFKTLSTEDFIDSVTKSIKDGKNFKLVLRFILRQGWLDWENKQSTKPALVLQNRTAHVLEKLNFQWPSVTAEIICDYLDVLSLNEGITMKKQPKIFAELEKLAPIIPAPISWADTNGVTLGANNLIYEAAGYDKNKIINKSAYDYDFYSKETTEKIMSNIKQVVQHKKTASLEVPINNKENEKSRWFLMTLSPLFSDDGKKVVGVIGSSTEITQIKEAEELRINNETQKTQIADHEKFRKKADQMAHDICSPINGIKIALDTKEMSHLSEPLRAILRNGTTRLEEIANTFKLQYGKYAEVVEEKPEPFLVSLALLDVISEKKYEYKNRLIRFMHDFDVNFTYIKTEPGQFKRMISNLINNAVEAIDEDDSTGQVDIGIKENAKEVVISIKDNGTGMPEEMVQKILQNHKITSTKEKGLGIGLSQIRDTLAGNNGKITISSKLGKGTTINLSFPKIATPNWITNQLELNKGDTVLILDDDPLIHKAWDLRFENYQGLNIKHFTDGEEVIAFAKKFTNKDKLLLLADYELLRQKTKLNGLDVIKSTNLKRRALVTSYYYAKKVQDQAHELGVKILPKQLASKVAISFSKK